MTIRHLFIGLAGGLAAILFSLLPPGELAELKGYDLLHCLRVRSAAPHDIVIVAIDEPSFAETGRPWPWPRSLHAQLVDALSRAGASVIAFDVLFAESSQPEEDRALARSLRAAGNVVLAADIETSEQQGFIREMRIEPYAVFSEQASSGIAKVPLDRDNVVRRFLPKREGERLFPEQIALLHRSDAMPVPAAAHIAFRSPPGAFRTVSYYQALQPEKYLPAGFFLDKIAIIGKTVSSATGTTSEYFGTPFLFLNNSALMGGVELQATMTQNVLDGAYVSRTTLPVRLLILFCLGLCGALLQFHWSPIKSALLTMAGILLYLVAVFVIFERFSYWVPTFSVLPALVIPYGVSAISAYLITEKNRREIRRAFGHYLSPAVLEAVLAAPEELKLGGKQVEATILFSDIAGFTTLSEKMRPDEIHGMMNLYFTEMSKLIFAERGTIDKYIGDAIMAFWGAPLPDPDHALHACRSAVAMQKALDALQPELQLQGYPPVSARIGINTGIVVAGNMGSETLFNYTVLGDAVNLASRLEGANKEFGTAVIISGATYEKVADHVEVRPLGSIRVKGKSHDVVIYELLTCA